jgi:hypothetical protein
MTAEERSTASIVEIYRKALAEGAQRARVEMGTESIPPSGGGDSQRTAGEAVSVGPVAQTQAVGGNTGLEARAARATTEEERQDTAGIIP